MSPVHPNDWKCEVGINTSRGARLYNPAANGGRPIEMRQAHNDVRGEISELLGKALNRGALDEELIARDKECMIAFLQLSARRAINMMDKHRRA